MVNKKKEQFYDICKEMRDNGHSYREISETTGVALSTIRGWLFDPAVKKGVSDQNLAKFEHARLMWENGCTNKEVCEKLTIGEATVSRWFSIFATENPACRMKKSKNKPTKVQGVKAPETAGASMQETPEQTISRLERELKRAKMEAAFYNEMINVAEKQFNVNIRKKAGARQ